MALLSKNRKLVVSLRFAELGIVAVCMQSLLSDPNPNSPANSEAARLYSENRCAVSSLVSLSVVNSRALLAP
jgi:ubiquitin-protein ligase